MTEQPQREPFTPLANLPWLRWIDRTEIPAVVIGLITLAVFLPFYNFNALMPQLPLSGGAFPPALALALIFLLQLTRGASRDLWQLIGANKIGISDMESIAAGPIAGRIELAVGLTIGLERVYSQVSFDQSGFSLTALATPDAFAVSLAIICYTVVQVHLLAFCIRQVVVFHKVANSFQVDLMTPELNNALSNPLLRFLLVGMIAASFGVLLYELVPYSSLQRRLLGGSLIAGAVWLVLIGLSMMPLLILKSRIAVAKSIEINTIRRALTGDFSGSENSYFGARLSQFSPADLMYYEDRIKNIWDWPIEAQIRRLVIFGLLPPLTWILAAAVEVIFETMLSG